MARILSRLALGFVLAMLTGTAAQAADAGRGGDAFDAHCAECHSVSSKLRNKKGPSLFGVEGRAAGTVAGFKYSDALLASGITWTAAELDAYLTQPKRRIPGGKMKFDGIDDASERADLIAFLAEQK